MGGLDGLVNNAGNNFWHSVAGATYEQIQACFMLNFYAAWAVSQEVYPALKAAGGGMVVNMASIHVSRTGAGVFPYNVSKSMLSSLTQSMALEWAADNIQAVAIAPGLIMTPLADAYFNQFDDPRAAQRQMERHYPLQRSGTPEDIGRADCLSAQSPVCVYHRRNHRGRWRAERAGAIARLSAGGKAAPYGTRQPRFRTVANARHFGKSAASRVPSGRVQKRLPVGERAI